MCPRKELKNIYRNTEIPSLPKRKKKKKGKIHYVWNLIKDYQACKEAGKYHLLGGEKSKWKLI